MQPKKLSSKVILNNKVEIDRDDFMKVMETVAEMNKTEGGRHALQAAYALALPLDVMVITPTDITILARNFWLKMESPIGVRPHVQKVLLNLFTFDGKYLHFQNPAPVRYLIDGMPTLEQDALEMVAIFTEMLKDKNEDELEVLVAVNKGEKPDYWQCQVWKERNLLRGGKVLIEVEEFVRTNISLNVDVDGNLSGTITMPSKKPAGN